MDDCGLSLSLQKTTYLEWQSKIRSGCHSIHDSLEIMMRNYKVEREENNHAWQATADKRYEEAIELYTLNLARQDRMTAYMNRGTTWLLMGNYERAEADFRKARNHPENSFAPLTNLKVGVALWLRGLKDAACDDWANEIRRIRSKVITQSDAAGGITPIALLWWASAHPEVSSWKKTADKELRHQWKNKTCQRNLWPGTLAPFLLGLIPQDALLNAAVESTSYEPIQKRHWRAAHFYIGAKCLDQNDLAGYEEHLKLCIQEEDILTAEYYLARYELDHL
jgi:tetratricopeptide (TPR) repeat protein